MPYLNDYHDENHSKNKEEQKVQIKESNGMKAEKKVTFADDDIKKKKAYLNDTLFKLLFNNF